MRHDTAAARYSRRVQMVNMRRRGTMMSMWSAIHRKMDSLTVQTKYLGLHPAFWEPMVNVSRLLMDHKWSLVTRAIIISSVLAKIILVGKREHEGSTRPESGGGTPTNRSHRSDKARLD